MFMVDYANLKFFSLPVHVALGVVVVLFDITPKFV